MAPHVSCALILALWLALSRVAPAEPEPEFVRVRIDTEPPGARVVVVTDPQDFAGGVPLNLEGGEVLINLQKDVHEGRMHLRLEHPWCEPLIIALEERQLKTASPQEVFVWPGHDKKIALNYRGAGALLHFLRQPPVLVFLAALLVVGARFGYRTWREKRLAEDTERRARIITDRTVPSTDPVVGGVLDGYHVIEKLGRGGMATVYQAIRGDRLESDETVAIKLMDQELSEEAECRQRFEREIRVLARLDHPNIVRVYDSGDHLGRLYLAMEFVQGKTLRDLTGRPMSLGEIRGLMEPVFRAMAYAHQIGVVHRDLKPENLMISEAGLVKVMDFGLARSEQFSTMTVSGSVLGTPAYLAPEQVQGRADPRTDQYALGVILYELLTGTQPFTGDALNVVMAHLTQEPPSLAASRPDVPPGVVAAVERMLSKDPQQRYPDLDRAWRDFHE
ncbi:MAG: serine/threonine protein kinase [Armatimonadetes bacterium]|nr:serine/threonine protein kinase [Armatimonadota bacterium]